MFRKSFKVKSSNQLKSSDKEKLKKEFIRYCQPKEDCLNEVFAKKGGIICSKIETAAHGAVHVYSIKRKPIIFKYNGAIFPTVYLLWEYPDLYLCEFTIDNKVVSILSSGSDVLARGVLYPKPPNTYEFLDNTTAYINTLGNKAAVAVGITAHSSTSLNTTHMHAKAVIIHHIWGDKLCAWYGLLPRPSLGQPDWCCVEEEACAQVETVPVPDIATKETEIKDAEITQAESTDTVTEGTEGKEAESPKAESTEAESTKAEGNIDKKEDATKEMDDLLKHCFLSAAKYSKGLKLPILSSTFYKLHMIPACPPNKSLDVKKSSYKKLSQFLNFIGQNGLLHVKEVKKGVDQIVNIDYGNILLADFKLNLEDRPKTEEKEIAGDEGPKFLEVLSVTAKVLPLFSKYGHRKGDIIEVAEVKTIVTKYVKTNNLTTLANPNFVRLDQLLRDVAEPVQLLNWNDLIQKVRSGMTTCYKVVHPNGEVEITRHQLEPIRITVAKRSGNKKVTLVANLTKFGINLNEFANCCQKGVSASTSIIRGSSSRNTDQLLIQGNQVLFVYNQLIDQQKIPKKYVLGLEFAPKQKK